MRGAPGTRQLTYPTCAALHNNIIRNVDRTGATRKTGVYTGSLCVAENGSVAPRPTIAVKPP